MHPVNSTVTRVTRVGCRLHVQAGAHLPDSRLDLPDLCDEAARDRSCSGLWNCWKSSLNAALTLRIRPRRGRGGIERLERHGRLFGGTLAARGDPRGRGDRAQQPIGHRASGWPPTTRG